MFLGVSLVQYNHMFNATFVVFTLLFTTLFRAIGKFYVNHSCGYKPKYIYINNIYYIVYSRWFSSSQKDGNLTIIHDNYSLKLKNKKTINT